MIDDLQAPPRADSLALIEEFFIRHHAEGRAIVNTSNLTRKQVETAWGDRLVDRLRDWGEFHELPGRSLRGSCGPAT